MNSRKLLEDLEIAKSLLWWLQNEQEGFGSREVAEKRFRFCEAAKETNSVAKNQSWLVEGCIVSPWIWIWICNIRRTS